jgi:hypothetical protein
MQVLNLINKNNYTLPYKLGKELGYGAHGQIFDLIDFPNKAIKLSVCFDQFDGKLSSLYEEINKNLFYIKTNKPQILVCVYEHNFILNGCRKTINKNQNYILYYYIMEKLQEISNDEAEVFRYILDETIVKDVCSADVLRNLQLTLDINKKNVMMFFDGLKNSKIKHLDLHVRNIMKDRRCNFKLIDLDLIEIGD